MTNLHSEAQYKKGNNKAVRSFWCRIKHLVAATVLVLTLFALNGCTLGIGLYVRNDCSFPVQIDELHDDIKSQPVDWQVGIVAARSQRKFCLLYRSLGTYHLLIRGREGKTLANVNESADTVRNRGKNPAALFLNIRPDSAVIRVGIDTDIQQFRIKLAIFVAATLSVILTIRFVYRKMSNLRKQFPHPAAEKLSDLDFDK